MRPGRRSWSESGVRTTVAPRRTADGRPAPLHDLDRSRARRDAPPDAEDLREQGPRQPAANAGKHAPLLGCRPREAAIDPAADHGARAQPGRRRGGTAARGRAAKGPRPARASRAPDARRDRQRPQAVPARPRALPNAAPGPDEGPVSAVSSKPVLGLTPGMA